MEEVKWNSCTLCCLKKQLTVLKVYCVFKRVWVIYKKNKCSRAVSAFSLKGTFARNVSDNQNCTLILVGDSNPKLLRWI